MLDMLPTTIFLDMDHVCDGNFAGACIRSTMYRDQNLISQDGTPSCDPEQ